MFFSLMHEHYWGIPIRGRYGYYMTCYECGKHRRVNINFDNQPEKSAKKGNRVKEHHTMVKLVA